jgi:putative Mg2+ transporter-C (MgtC) family protein
MTLLSNWETLARLLVAAIFGSLIGFERERLLWAAGIRTHMLVCVVNLKGRLTNLSSGFIQEI